MSITALPNDLVTEILTRLPGKQVRRCKCVCKLWRTIILSHMFMKKYQGHQSGLLLYWLEDLRQKNFSGRFHVFHCPLRRPEEPLEEFSRLERVGTFQSPGLIGMSQLVHGLICVGEPVKSLSKIYSLSIHNMCTGEMMKAPDPLPCIETFSTYHLGYDPVSRLYKLLRLIYDLDEYLMQEVHIMTLRPPSGSLSTWRELDLNAAGMCDLGLLPFETLFEIRTSHVDGMLFWTKNHDALLCFDLTMESFRLINYPEKCIELRSVIRFKDKLSLWTITRGGCDHKVNGICCYVQEDDEGKNWSKHRPEILNELMESGGFAIPSEDNNFTVNYMPLTGEYSMRFSSSGEMLVKNLDESWRVYSHSRQDADKEDVWFVGKIPDGASCILYVDSLYHFWLTSDIHQLARLTRLMDANNLYLSLDDILSGGTAIV